MDWFISSSISVWWFSTGKDVGLQYRDRKHLCKIGLTKAPGAAMTGNWAVGISVSVRVIQDLRNIQRAG
jgi:hypothetical protein